MILRMIRLQFRDRCKNRINSGGFGFGSQALGSEISGLGLGFKGSRVLHAGYPKPYRFRAYKQQTSGVDGEEQDHTSSHQVITPRASMLKA